jgi:hypothetical protein
MLGMYALGCVFVRVERRISGGSAGLAWIELNCSLAAPTTWALNDGNFSRKLRGEIERKIGLGIPSMVIIFRMSNT